MAGSRQSKKRKSEMLIPTIIMAVLALVLLYMGYQKGEGQHVTGLKSAFDMVIQILPLLVFAFIVAGMVRVLLPQELLSKWVGQESGFRGIIIGTVAGGLAPGGPYVSLPVAFLTGWSLWAVSRLPMEVGIMGWRFTVIRFACTFFFPPIAGLIANRLFPNFM
jgi:uncharacterized membrane protein YraQ (UPF0718 family)